MGHNGRLVVHQPATCLIRSTSLPRILLLMLCSTQQRKVFWDLSLLFPNIPRGTGSHPVVCHCWCCWSGWDGCSGRSGPSVLSRSAASPHNWATSLDVVHLCQSLIQQLHQDVHLLLRGHDGLDVSLSREEQRLLFTITKISLVLSLIWLSNNNKTTQYKPLFPNQTSFNPHLPWPLDNYCT